MILQPGQSITAELSGNATVSYAIQNGSRITSTTRELVKGSITIIPVLASEAYLSALSVTAIDDNVLVRISINAVGLLGDIKQAKLKQNGSISLEFDKWIVTDESEADQDKISVENLTIGTYGDSTASIGDSQSPANNDISIATAPMPGAGATTLSRFLDKTMLSNLMPGAVMVSNCGFTGRTNATALADELVASTISTRKVIDAVKQTPNVVLFRGASINDFIGASYPISDSAYNTIVDNYKLQLSRLMATGSYILAQGMYGYSLGLPGYPVNANGNAIRAAIVRFNEDIKAYVSSFDSGVFYIDSVGLNCDTTGAYLPGHTTLADGVHLSMVGSYYRALREKEILESLFTIDSKIVHKGANVQINPLFAAVTTVGHGVVPDNYVYQSPVNCTRQNGKIEYIDGKAWSTLEWLTTATAVTSGQIVLPYNPLATGTNPLNIAINDRYGFEFDFFIENLTRNSLSHITQLLARVRTYEVTNARSILFDFTTNFTSDAGASIPGRLYMHFATPPIVYQEAAATYGTSSTWQFNWSLDAIAGDLLKTGISSVRIVKL